MSSTSGPGSSDTLRVLQGLALKRGLTLGRMSEQERLVTLGFASLSIPAAESLSEADVNRALKAWLAADGQMLRIDHVELRRTLIDMGLWQRDGFGRAYGRATLKVDHPAQVHLTAMAVADLRSLIADARAAREAQRQTRRAALQGEKPR